MSGFKKGLQVTKFLSGGGFTTEEEAVILKVDKKGVWLDNGEGNDPSGPFNSRTGRYEGPMVPGFSMRIE